MKTVFRKLPGWVLLNIIIALLYLSPWCRAGNVVVWGDNSWGQLNLPSDLTNVVAVAAGVNHSLALRADGTVTAWGANDSGQSAVPADLTNIVDIGAGGYFSLAIKSDSTVTGWGAVPAGLSSLSNVVAVAGGVSHMLALKSDGTVAALGDNTYYQCNVPAGLSNVVAIAAGNWHSCALTADGNVTTWGSTSGDHQLAAPETGRGVNIVSCYDHGMVLTAEGVLYPWGDDDLARIYGYSIYPPLWYPGAGTGDAAIIGNGFFHFLAASVNGGAVAWGRNNVGQLNVPSGTANIVQMAGGYYHSLALTGDGSPRLANRRLGLSMLPPNTATSSETVTLHVAASGAAPLTYYWLFNGTNFQTTDLPRLYLTNIQPAQAGTYSVIVSNSLGWFQGSNQVLAVQALKITGQPAAQAVYEAADTGFSVTAVGTDLNYQWRFNGGDLPGETNATLNRPVVATNQAGVYSVLITNLYGSILSSNASLTVTLPAITVNPTNRTVNSGSSTTFTVTATGAALSYQWLLNGTNLPAATNAVLTLGTVTTNDAGIYQALVSNAYRVLQSSNAQLDVVALTLTQPTNRTVYSGDSTTFSTTAQGTGPFTYQWTFQGTNLPAATGASFALSNVTNSNAGNYAVIVGNNYGTVTSANASLVVLNNKPIITSQPASRGGYPGGNASFQVAADGSKPLSYQWRLNGTNILNATNATLTLSNLASTNAGNYSVLVGNPVGSTLSSNAALVFLNVTTWGQTNNYGLGIIPLDLTNAIAVAVGGSHSVAVKSDGRVIAWGYNYWGQTNVPASATNVIAIAAAQDHTIALRSNGTVVVWGNGAANVPANLSNVIAVAAGDYHSMALKADGTVVAWGDGGYVNSASTNVPANATNIVAIAAGGSFSVALKQNGTVIDWGTSYTFTGITNAVAITANEFPIVILKSDGKVYATNVLAAPAGLSNVVGVAAQRYTASALKSDGTVTNWGSGGPTTPAGLTNVAVLVSGQYHCLAILGSGPQPEQTPFDNLKRISNSFSLSLPAKPGHLYWLEYKTNLTDTGWKTLALSPGISNSVMLTDNAATNAMRIYRARQW